MSKCCDKCQDNVREEKDFIVYTRNVIECLSQIRALQPKLKLTDLVMTYIGSKAKAITNHSFHTVPQYGQGKTKHQHGNSIYPVFDF